MGDRSLRFLLLGEDKSASKSLDKVGKKADGLHHKLTDVAGKLGSGFGLALGGGIAGIGVAMHSAIEAASDMNESLSKSQAVFGRYSASVEAYAKDNRKNILLTNQAAIEGAATFGNLFVAMGLGQQKSAGLSTSLVGLASDLSSFNNVDTGEALESLRSGLLGEAEPMRKFGVQLSQARIEAEAYALGLVKPSKDVHKITAANNAVAVATSNLLAVQKKHGKNSLEAKVAQDKVVHSTDLLAKAMKGQKVTLSAAQKAQAAYSIIMKDTKTAQGDAARTAGGYANATRILQKKIADSRAEIGQKLLPVVLRATTGFSHLIDEFKDGTGAGGQLRDVMREAGTVLNDSVIPALKWLGQHPDVLKATATAVGAYALGMKAAATWTGLVALRAPAAAVGIEATGAAASTAMIGLAPFAIAAGGLLVTLQEIASTNLLTHGLDKQVAALKAAGDPNASTAAAAALGVSAGTKPGQFIFDPKTNKNKRDRGIQIVDDASHMAAKTSPYAGTHVSPRNQHVVVNLHLDGKKVATVVNGHNAKATRNGSSSARRAAG